MRFLARKDVVAGLMFVVIGLAFCYAASSYRMGDVGRMGPGYFPFWLGVLLATLGALVFVSALRAEDTDEVRHRRWSLKALVVVVGSIALFGVLLVPMGLVVAIVVLVVASSIASPEFTWTGTLLNAAVLIALSVVIFAWGIGLPLPILPAFLTN